MRLIAGALRGARDFILLVGLGIICGIGFGYAASAVSNLPGTQPNEL